MSKRSLVGHIHWHTFTQEEFCRQVERGNVGFSTTLESYKFLKEWGFGPHWAWGWGAPWHGLAGKKGAYDRYLDACKDKNFRAKAFGAGIDFYVREGSADNSAGTHYGRDE